MPQPTTDGNVDQGKFPSPEAPETQLLFAKLIQEINKRLTSGLEYERVLDFIFEAVGVLIPFDRMGIALVDEKAESLRLDWVRSKIPYQYLRKNFSAPLKGSSLQKIFDTGKPRIISDLVQYATEHPESQSTKLILKDGIRSSLTCPLKSGDKPIGIVFFSSRKPYTYNDNHIDVLLEIADELSVIVEQGKLRNYFSASSTREKTIKMILHDLKSPLNVIRGFLDLTADEDWYRNLGPEGKEIFAILQRNTTYMTKLVEELGELSELNRIEIPLESSDVSLSDFVTEMSEHGRSLCSSKEIHFEAKIDPHLPPTTRFDPQRIRRVVDNLFTNAVKFSNRGTTIVFEVNHVPGRIVFSVEDQGQGIPEEEQSKLFTEFGKTSVRPTEGEASSGLGLVIAKKIVERHMGEIRLTSCTGQGSTFSFWIPTSNEALIH